MSVENQSFTVKRVIIRPLSQGHKGAWKIAYADFVTAMMAFFLLMWLLSATTERQRKGLSDYFSPSVSLSKVSTGGEGLLFGEELRENASRAHHEARGNIELHLRLERQLKEEIAETFAKADAEHIAGQGLSDQIRVKISDEGLVIELFDIEGFPLFWGMGPKLTPRAQLLLASVGKILQAKAQDIAVQAHLRSLPNAFQPLDLWGLSFTRAAFVQEILRAQGFAAQNIKRLTGYADRRHAVPDPVSIRNNRIEIILLDRSF